MTLATTQTDLLASAEEALLPIGAINPLLLYAGCVLGAIGVAIAMPRRRVSLALIGTIIAAAAAGLVVLGLTLRAVEAEQLPNIFFHGFAVLALGGALRMITHPRPVYAALYFILTIVASCGMYLLLSAEFMAFALVIIYAGAILITYLFVIMLATQAPSEEDADRLSEYDATAREPVAATVTGFVLLAVLTTLLFRGQGTLERSYPVEDREVLARLPLKSEEVLRDAVLAANLIGEDERIARGDDGRLLIDPSTREVTIVAATTDPETGETRRERARVAVVPPQYWPEESLAVTNPEGLGVVLLGEHPMTIEIAGVVLLMAMLGATVLARKQVDVEEEAKARQARTLGLDPNSGADLPAGGAA